MWNMASRRSIMTAKSTWIVCLTVCCLFIYWYTAWLSTQRSTSRFGMEGLITGGDRIYTYQVVGGQAPKKANPYYLQTHSEHSRLKGKAFPFVTHVTHVRNNGIEQVMTHYDPDMDQTPNCPDTDVVVPDILHWFWFFKTPAPFKFHHYMSALSAVRVHRPRQLYMWHDALPEGELWRKLASEINSSSGRLLQRKNDNREANSKSLTR